jgi:dihydrofolate synthase/folylpolyglutamate synthase
MQAGRRDFFSRLDALNEFKFDYSLERVKKALKLSGSPQDAFAVIHVTGSNGKGSVVSYLSNILAANGYKTGTYTSPHLIDVRERIAINNGIISAEKFRAAGTGLFRLLDGNKIRLTYFEFLTVLAFVLFRAENVKAAVIEVGLGGRFDATNVSYKNKLLSIITSISLEHTALLGNTEKKILVEKEQIIGSKTAVVNLWQKGLKSYLKKKYDGKIIFADEAYPAARITPGKRHLEAEIGGNIYRSSMIESVQAGNIATVLAALEIMKKKGFVFDAGKVKKAILNTMLPGRMTLNKKGYYLSVAHNPAAIKQALDTAAALYPEKPFVYIFSALKDKDIASIFGIIAQHKNIKLILTDIDNERGFTRGALLKIAEKHGIKALYFSDNKEALRRARKIKKNGIILVGGSFYLVKEFV